MAEDVRLGLSSKLELAANEKRGKDFAEALDPSIELPKGGFPRPESEVCLFWCRLYCLLSKNPAIMNALLRACLPV